MGIAHIIIIFILKNIKITFYRYDFVSALEGHVELVDHQTLVDMALQRG